ncbi:succinylglutamate desuccinylase/aspartoacylase family protein [Azospirillum thermophilum]|uniref:succinylglutamate desuccinylase/aspartoacylase family protein n=1 Tax=Azospirillum thermophilum TaxID=2202148 RepID=UPI001FE4026B|nr:succinylglutamate desuccinylase/aspartoacylase family protein [Azospirillum thermophilum]
MTHRVEPVPLPSGRLGTSRSLTVHHFGTPGARPKAYIQAALHADETPGLLVAHHLIRRLRDLDAAGRIAGDLVVVPAANPIGLSQVVEGVHVGRYGLEGGGNFNRSFANLTDRAAALLDGRIGPDAAANVAEVRAALRAAHAALPQPRDEVAALRRLLQSMALDADYVLDLHCDLEAVPHLYTGDALWPDLSDLAALLGARAVLLASESGGDPFDEACSAPGGCWRTASPPRGRSRRPAPPPPSSCAARRTSTMRRRRATPMRWCSS